MTPHILSVHQVGKVGSTTVAQALQRMFPRENVYQTHVLDAPALLQSLDRWIRHPESPRLKLPDHLVSSVELGRHFLPQAPPVNWWLVSLVREPLGRNISAFFQNLHRHWIYRLSPANREICRRVVRNPLRGSTTITEDEMNGLVRELTALFKGEGGRGIYDKWFDREMRGVFGIDVFGQPFPAGRGYATYGHGPTRMLLIRLEDLPRVFLPAIDEWLDGAPFGPAAERSISFERERSNDGSTKTYADVYEGFRRELRVSPADLDAVYNSRVARHFYTDAERAKFRSRWETDLPEETPR